MDYMCFFIRTNFYLFVGFIRDQHQQHVFIRDQTTRNFIYFCFYFTDAENATKLSYIISSDDVINAI